VKNLLRMVLVHRDLNSLYACPCRGALSCIIRFSTRLTSWRHWNL